MVQTVGTAASPDDIVLFLLTGAGSGTKYLTGATSKIHQTIFELKEMDPELFQDFVFNTNRIFPYCEQIDDALSSLRWNRLISMENIGFRAYTIKDTAKRVLEKEVKPAMNAATVERLMKASEFFWEKLEER